MARFSAPGIVLTVVFGCLLVAGPAAARDWTKYENAHFVAYSDTSRRTAGRILGELENFRAAAEQFLAFQKPEDAPKARVLIFDSADELAEITGRRSIRSFMTSVDGTPYIVMLAGSRRDWTESSIRHEMIHVLLRNSPHRLPPWYQEGIADFMSSTEFLEDATRFTIGKPVDWEPIRAPFVHWDELMDGEFRFHTAETAPGISHARRQAWQLVHYLAIGDQFAHHEKLSLYLGRFSAGESSYEALEAAFGMTAEQIGERVTQELRTEVPYYVINFDDGARDHDFLRTEANLDELRPALEVLKSRWAAEGS